MFHRSVFAGLLLVPVLCCTLAAQSAPPIEPFVSYAPDETELGVLPLGTPGGADHLDATASCHETTPRAALVGLRWSAASSEAGGTQRVDISKLRDGFATDRFAVTRLLPGDTTAVGIEGPEPGINYYWRVLTETPGGWVSSKVERFEVPVCPFDEVDPSRFGEAGSAASGPDQNDGAK